jgi:lysyl-tRNA synthetase class 2
MADDVIPYSFDRSHSAAEVNEEWGSIKNEAETGETVSVAGRLMLRREQGKICFGKLVDSSGNIQLFASANDTEDFDGFKSLNLGDWIGAKGDVFKTKRGELSVRVQSWQLLARARRNFGDKWRGVSDTDTRYRQRYVDLWANEESRATFLMRSKIVSFTRRFLDERGYVEVETPTLHPIPGGALAKPFTTHHNALDLDLYLRIATELYLKRLVVGGIEKVYEIGRVFRNEGLSTRHNPEFTMLECYEAYGDYTTYMEMTEQLVSSLSQELLGTTTIPYGDKTINVATPWRRANLIDLVKEIAGVEISLDMSRDELTEIAKRQDVEVHDSYGPGKIILEIYEKTTEGQIWDPTFVYGYPKEVSPLSREDRNDPRLTERFEAIVAGSELCNAFSELVDPDEQLRRFEEQASAKAAGDEEAMVVDKDYVRALEYGLPPTVGLGVGIDRLTMLLTNTQSIRDVVLFPTLRPEQDD